LGVTSDIGTLAGTAGRAGQILGAKKKFLAPQILFLGAKNRRTRQPANRQRGQKVGKDIGLITLLSE